MTIGKKLTSMLMPWGMIPLLLVFSLSWVVTPIVRVRFSYLCIPVAVYLGHRYGRRGIIAVAIGGVALPLGISMGPWSLPSEIAVYVIALLAALLASVDRPVFQMRSPLRLPWLFPTAFVVLPLDLQIYRSPVVSLELFLLPLLFFLLFVLGISDTRQGLVTIALAIATTIGMVAELTGLADIFMEWTESSAEGIGFLADFRIRYALDKPVYFLTGMAYYFSGRYLAGIARSDPAEAGLFHHRAAALGVLLVLWGGSLFYLHPYGVKGFYGAFLNLRLVGTIYALPLTAFFAGLVFRFKGIALVVAFSVYLVLLEVALLTAHDLHRYLRLDVQDPLYCFAFGVLGLRVGDATRGIPTRWAPGSWAAYIGLLLLTIPLIFHLEDSGGFFTALAILAALIGFGILARKIRRLAVRSQDRATGRGWIALAGLVLFAFTFHSNMRETVALLAETVNTIKMAALFISGAARLGASTNESLLAVGVLCYVSIILTVLGEFVRKTPAIVAESIRIGLFVRASLGRRRFMVALFGATERARGGEMEETGHEPERIPANKYLRATTTALAWARNLTFAVAVVMIVVLMLNQF